MDAQRVEVPTTIETTRLRLYRYREKDAEAVFAAMEESRAELETWMPWARFITSAEQVRDETPRSLGRWENGEDYGYTIARREDGRVVGSINLQDPNWSIPAFDLGYWIRTSETGRGYASEAARALVRVAFHDLGARRVQILCDDINERSIRVAEATGAVLEGHTRNDNRIPRGDLCGTMIFGLVERDEAVRALLAEGS